MGAGLTAAGPVAQLAAMCNRRSLGLILPVVIPSESTSCRAVMGSLPFVGDLLKYKQAHKKEKSVGGGRSFQRKDLERVAREVCNTMPIFGTRQHSSISLADVGILLFSSQTCLLLCNK